MADAAPKKAPVKFAPARLEAFVTALFERAGLSAEHAATVARVLVWSNLRGMDSHGVIRTPKYVSWTTSGEMNPRPELKVVMETPAVALVEGDRGPGAVTMTLATRLAAAKAKAVGIGLGVVRGTTHTGAIGYYVRELANEGLVGIATTGSVPNMAYHGARAAGVSTSPLAIAAPGEDAPLVVDIATGVVSMGKLMQARRTGEQLAPGLALDKDGQPTTDPNAALNPLPLGGPKGSGFALLVECITSLLVGNPILAAELEKKTGRHRQNSLIIAIDVARFGEPAAFRREVARLGRAIKGLPPDPDAGGILLPGERGDRIAKQRAVDGIPLPPALHAELNVLAESLGVASLTPNT